jgi:hypothetical protein
MKATDNKLEHNDYQHPQGMWHSCTSGKEPCAHLAIEVWLVILCAYQMIEIQWNKQVRYLSTILTRGPLTINNYDNVSISLCTISHESFEIKFGNPCFNIVSLNFIHINHWASMSLDCISQKIYGHHFTIGRIVHMASHNCPISNTFHMIKHDPNILQIHASCIHVTKLTPFLTLFIDILKINTFCPKTCPRKQYS